MTLAIAAPPAFRPSTEMKMGSKRILTIAPPMVPIIDSFDMPSERRRFEWMNESTSAGAPIASHV